MDRKGTVRLGKGKKARAKRGKVALMALFCAYTFTACGNKEQTSIYDFAGVEPKEIDPWVYLGDTALSSNQQILNFASSASRLAITIGVTGIVFSILFMAVRLLFSGSSKTRSEVKEEAFLKGLIAIMLFSIPLWLGVCKLVGEMLV